MRGLCQNLRPRRTFAILVVSALAFMVIYAGLYKTDVTNFRVALNDIRGKVVSPFVISRTEIHGLQTSHVSNGTKGSISVNTNIKDPAVQSIKTTPSPPEVCHFTEVDAFDPNVMKLVTYYPPISCTGLGTLSLVYVDGDILRVNVTKMKSSPEAKDFAHCRYKPIFKNMTSDSHVWLGGWSEKFHEQIKLTDRDEYIMNECYDKNDVGISKSYLYHVAWDEEKDKQAFSTGYAKHLEQFGPKEKLNVLLVGIDGMAKKNFERTMPKTRDYILKEHAAIELEKFNKVGVNTFPNMVAMLMGKTVGELGHHWNPKMSLEEVNRFFVWSDFKAAGYRTALDLEEAWCTPFRCEGRTGFHKKPTDMYTLTLSIPMDTDPKLKHPTEKRCKGDKPSFSIHNDFLTQLATRYNQTHTPFFGISFLTLLTHDNLNNATAGDEWYLEFFKELKRRNVLQNTIMVFYSDHGERYGPIRRTYNGVVESKTPMIFFILPEWFKIKYPDEVANLRTNAKRLTSTFDLHATCKDILYFKSTSRPPNLYTGPGISLFQKIPKQRLCEDAKIPFGYCNCNSMTKKPIDETSKQKVSAAVTDAINEMLVEETDCKKLAVKSIHSIMLLQPPKDWNRKVFDGSTLYHISIVATPGDAVFETEAVLDASGKAKVVGSISRLNMYRGTRNCVKKWEFRKFCYCPEL